MFFLLSCPRSSVPVPLVVSDEREETLRGETEGKTPHHHVSEPLLTTADCYNNRWNRALSLTQCFPKPYEPTFKLELGVVFPCQFLSTTASFFYVNTPCTEFQQHTVHQSTWRHHICWCQNTQKTQTSNLLITDCWITPCSLPKWWSNVFLQCTAINNLRAVLPAHRQGCSVNGRLSVFII